MCVCGWGVVERAEGVGGRRGSGEGGQGRWGEGKYLLRSMSFVS